jgi:hypothetical protein
MNRSDGLDSEFGLLQIQTVDEVHALKAKADEQSNSVSFEELTL